MSGSTAAGVHMLAASAGEVVRDIVDKFSMLII